MGKIAHLLTDDIWVKTPTGSHNNAGIPTFGTATKQAARVEYETKIVAGPNGRETTATIRVVTETEIVKGALIFLNSGAPSDNNNGYEVLTIKHALSPLDGEGFWEVRA